MWSSNVYLANFCTTYSFKKYQIYHRCAFIAGLQHKPNLTPHYQKFYQTIHFLDRVHFIECKHRKTRIVLTDIKENSTNTSLVKKKWINFYTPLQLLVAKVCMHLVEVCLTQLRAGVCLAICNRNLFLGK